MFRSLCLLSVAALPLLVAACTVDSSNDQGAEDASNTGNVGSPLSIVALPSGYDIPSTGDSNPGFAAVDNAIRKFMDERCVGAAVIGIARDGTVIHNRGFGYRKGPPNAKCGSAADPFLGGTKYGAADPMRDGSNAKWMLAAVFRKHIKKALSAARGGAPVTDQDIEALKLLDNGEISLVAPRVRAAMLSGTTNANINDLTNEPCVPKAWSQVTLGQLLKHKAGLSSTELVYDELSDIRNLSSSLTLALQQNASGAPAAARTALQGAHGSNAYFVPKGTLEELMVGQGNRCFAHSPGTTTKYSNAGFTLLGYVLEHVTGRSFAGRNGFPESHAGSLLSEFTSEELGFAYGIEQSHTALGARDIAEPSYRSWSAAQNTYYPLVNDDKRPWCILAGGQCDFSAFESGTTRFAWDWMNHKVEHSYRSNSVAPGTGALAVEAPKALAWMSKYTVSTPYGGARALYKGTHRHYGELGGTASWVEQFGGDAVGYPGFGENPDGTTNFAIRAKDDPSCVIPKGVDVIFSMNQTGDPKCTQANGCVVCVNTDDNCKEKNTAYSAGYYDGLIKEALCSVDWSLGPQ